MQYYLIFNSLKYYKEHFFQSSKCFSYITCNNLIPKHLNTTPSFSSGAIARYIDKFIILFIILQHADAFRTKSDDNEKLLWIIACYIPIMNLLIMHTALQTISSFISLYFITREILNNVIHLGIKHWSTSQYHFQPEFRLAKNRNLCNLLRGPTRLNPLMSLSVVTRIHIM